MHNDKYYVYSEFSELRKIAEESEEPEEKDEAIGEEVLPEDPEEPSEVTPVEEDELEPSESFGEDTRSAITLEVAKIIANSDPEVFFEQELDKTYPELALLAMDKLWLHDFGYWTFFRLKRNGIRLYKEYPNSVESFIIRRLPVNYYFRWKLNEEFPQFLEALKRKWEGFPDAHYHVKKFFVDGLYSLNPEETLAGIEKRTSQEDREIIAWINSILNNVPDSFIKQNFNFFVDLFNRLGSEKVGANTVANIYFERKLYEQMPELLGKMAGILTAHAYFSTFKVHKIEDKEVVNSRIRGFSESGSFYAIPKELLNTEIYALAAKKEFSELSRYIKMTEAGETYTIIDEEYDEEVEVDLEYVIRDVSFDRIFDYIKILNGENFSALDENYQDESKDIPGISFKKIFEFILKDLKEDIFRPGSWGYGTSFDKILNFIFNHKYNILFKDIVDESLSELITNFSETNSEAKSYFQNSFLKSEIKNEIITNHSNYFDAFFQALLEAEPSAWVENFSEDYPQFDNIVLERLKRSNVRYFSQRNNKYYSRHKDNIISNVIEASEAFYKKHYDSLKSMVKELYLDSDFIKTYFKLYHQYFPDLVNESIEDKDSEENITPIIALIKKAPHLYFSSKSIRSDELGERTPVMYPKSDALGLIEKYPGHAGIALSYMLQMEALNSTHLSAFIPFILHSDQFSDEIRREIIESADFKNLLKHNINKDTLKEYLDRYPVTFKDELKKYLEEQLLEISSYGEDRTRRVVSFSNNHFVSLFFEGPPYKTSKYRDLFPDISRRAFSVILERSKEFPDILNYVDTFTVYPDIFNQYIKSFTIYKLIDLATGKSSYRTNWKTTLRGQLNAEASRDVFLSKIEEKLNSNSNEFLNTIFKSADKTSLILGTIFNNESVKNLFFNSLLEYDLNLAFAISLLKMNNRTYERISLPEARHDVDIRAFPDFDNYADKLLSIPAEQIDFDIINSRISSSDSIRIIYLALDGITKDETLANSENSIKLKKSFDRYLLNNEPDEAIKLSDDSSIVSQAMESIANKIKELNSLSELNDKDRAEKEKFINYAKRSLNYLYESTWAKKPIFDKKEQLTVSLAELSEDPLFYFELKYNIIRRNEQSGKHQEHHTEQFDLNYFDEIEDFKKQSLFKISNNSELFDTFIARRYFELILKQEYIDLIKLFAKNNIDKFVFFYKEYDHRDHFNIIDEELGLKNYLSKILLEKEKIVDIFSLNLFKYIIENNLLSLDNFINLFIKSIKERENRYGGITPADNLKFFDYLKHHSPGRVDEILKELYGYKPYDLSFIEKINEKVGLDIAKKIVLNSEEHKAWDLKIKEAFNYPNVFNHPETEAALLKLIKDGTATISSKGLNVYRKNIMSLSKFIMNNFIFYKKYKDSIPEFNIGFGFFRDLKNRSVAIEIIDELKNDDFLSDQKINMPSASRGTDIILEEIQGIKDLKINRSMYQSEQRPEEFMGASRYTLSQINTRPTDSMYEINKQLIHAGDGVAHTNVGASGFTSSWGLFSIQTDFSNSEDGESFFVIEQYQSDYPVVLNEIFNVEKNGPKSPYYRNFEHYEQSLEGNQRLKEKYPRHYKDIVAHFNIISAAYPYLILSKAIQIAVIAGLPHIYILKDAARLADIKNQDKAKKLYEDIPLMVASGTRLINKNLCWKIEATQTNINKLMSKAREITGRDSQYDFSLSPAQNAQLRMRDRERRKKSPWAASAEKLQKLEEINRLIRSRFPELNVPDFTNPTDAIRFLNEEAKPWAIKNEEGMTKGKAKKEFSPIVRDLAILKRSWERIVGMMKFAKLSRGKNRFRSLELIYLEACFSRFLK